MSKNGYAERLLVSYVHHMPAASSNRTRLSLDQLKVGSHLPCDVFDKEGKLLLRRGAVIDRENHLARLISEGLYAEGDVDTILSTTDKDSGMVFGVAKYHKSHPVNVFEMLDHVRADLEGLLNQESPDNFSDRISALANQIQHAIKLDGDAALATIQWLTHGQYAIRRMLHGAILVNLMLGEKEAEDDECHFAMCAALTMNIAMIELQDVLYLQSTPPNKDQQEQVKIHPQRGQEILRSLGVTDERWLTIVGQHHETIDGRGYPEGLSGSNIIKCAQLLSLADRYGAMATGRAYRAPALPSAVLKQIFVDRGKGVGEHMVALLLKCVGLYPPGSIVELANNDIAVVISRTQNPKQPVVRSVKDAYKRVYDKPRKRHTSEPQYAIIKILPMDAIGFKVDPKNLWENSFVFD